MSARCSNEHQACKPRGPEPHPVIEGTMQQSLRNTANPAFLAYVFTCLVLNLNLLMLWVSSGAIRAQSGVAINPEDGARYGAPVSELDPPAVARLLRAR